MNETTQSRVLRFRRLKSEGFASFRGEIEFPTGNLVIISGPNEAGKSTIVNALLASLYGVKSGRKKTDQRPDKNICRPWNPDWKFLVELEAEQENQLWVVRRDFRNGKMIVLRDNNDLTENFTQGRNQDGFGEFLTGGLSASAYLRSFFLTQEKAVLLAQPGDLVEIIQQTVTTSPGDQTTRAACELVQQAIEGVYAEGVYKGNVLAENAFNRIREKLAEVSGEITAWEESQERSREDLETLREKQELVENLNREAKAIKKGLLIFERSRLSDRLMDSHEQERRKNELLAEQLNLKDVEGFSFDLEKRLDSTLERYKEAEERAQAQQYELDKKKTAWEKERIRLEEYAPFSAFDEKTLEIIDRQISRWSDENARLDRLNNEMEELKHSMIGRGLIPSQLEKGQLFLESQTPDSISELEDLLERKKEATRRFEEADKQVADFQLPKRKIRPKGIGLSIAVIAIIAAIGAALEWKTAAKPGAALIVLLTALFLVILLAVLEHTRFQRKRSDVENILKHRKKELEELEELLNQKALDADLADDDELEDILQYSTRIAGLGSDYFAKKKTLETVWNDVTSLEDEILPYLVESKVVREGNRPTSGEMNGFHSRIRKYRDLLVESRSVRINLQSSEESLRGAQERVRQLWNELNQLLDKVDIPLGDDVDAAVQQFREKSIKAHRLKDIHQELLQIETEIDQKISEDEIRKKIREIDESLRLYKDVEAIEGKPINLNRRQDSVEQDIRQIQQEINDDRIRLIHETDEIPQKLASLHNEKARLESQYQTLKLQVDAAELALETLEKVEKEVYGNASRLLNRKLGPLLKKLIPRWSETEFDDDLRIQSKDQMTGKEFSSDSLVKVLSAGARDAIYLGARLALSEYLAGGRIDSPYILDEPFAHLDDNRFIQGMELLEQLVLDGKQIVVFTCHTGRHREWLQSRSDKQLENITMIEMD